MDDQQTPPEQSEMEADTALPRRPGRGRPALPRRRLARNPRPEAMVADEERSPARENSRPEGGKRLVRQRREDNKYDLPKRKWAKGMSYEWKRVSVFGQPDPYHMTNLRANHWSPVPSSRHPEMMPEGHSGPIVIDGQMLMERPDYLTDEAVQEDYQIARNQVRSVGDRVSGTPGGTLTRDHPSVRSNSYVKTNFEAPDPSIVPK